MHVDIRRVVPLLGRFTVSVGLAAASVALAPAAFADDTGTAAPAGTVSSGPTAGDAGGTPSGSTSTDPSTSSSTSPDPGTGSGTDPSTSPSTSAGTDPSTDPSTGSTASLPTFSVSSPGVPAVSTAGTQAVTYTANRPDATFECHLDTPDAPGTWGACPGTPTTDAVAASSTVVLHYTGLHAGRQTLLVRATDPAAGTDGTAPATVESSPVSWLIGPVFSPDHYSVPAGASFNNPYGLTAANRRNLTHVIRTINSMPGYRVNNQGICPTTATQYPSTIRITLYSASDMTFARALTAASRRCVSVQVLMNGHLKPTTTPSVRWLENHFGNHVYDALGHMKRSFSHRCHAGCRGGGVLHSKMYLFDSPLTAPGGTRIADTVMVGSSNMTSNAARVQWNDLYTVRGAASLHQHFLAMFDNMARDHDQARTVTYTDGIYQSTFTPVTPGTADPTMTALRSIHCTGAAAGSGIGGHTVVYVNMHAWFGLRGYALAQKVRSLYAQGCYVKILYSFMSVSVYKTLTYGTGPRMSARRTIFPKRDGIHAKHYSHFKNVAVNGYVGSDRSARVVWTGSNNFTNDGLHYDEVTLRIASASAYNQYVAQFRYMSATHSASNYLKLLEPIGGGRAIDAGV